MICGRFSGPASRSVTRRTERGMVRLKLPLLVWEDHDGGFTASTLDGVVVAAVGVTSSKAIGEIKKQLGRIRKTGGRLVPPEFYDAELCSFPMSVRPAYDTGKGVRNYSRPLPIRVPAVVGRRADGSFVCVLLTLDSRFECDSRATVERGGEGPRAAEARRS